MKRIALSTLSLALLGAAGAAHAQSSVTLYGTIDTAVTFVHNANAAGQNQWSVGNNSNGDLSGTRWGLKGQEDLGGLDRGHGRHRHHRMRTLFPGLPVRAVGRQDAGRSLGGGHAGMRRRSMT